MTRDVRRCEASAAVSGSHSAHYSSGIAPVDVVAISLERGGRRGVEPCHCGWHRPRFRVGDRSSAFNPLEDPILADFL